MRSRKFKVTLAISFVAGAFLFDGDIERLVNTGSPVGEAMARVGRPATATSVAGVARRATRRTVRRSAIYINSLPTGCVITKINGATYWRCGGTYYARSGGRYQVIYLD